MEKDFFKTDNLSSDNDSNSFDNDSSRDGDVVSVYFFPGSDRMTIKLVKTFVNTIMDYLCDEVVTFIYVFIIEDRVKEVHEGVVISSTDHKEYIILESCMERMYEVASESGERVIPRAIMCLLVFR